MSTTKQKILKMEEYMNAEKLGRLIMKGGQVALQGVFSQLYHPPWLLSGVLASKYEALSSLLDKKVISKEQWELLFPPDGSPSDVENYDARLCFLLLHNVCGLKKPIMGWKALPLHLDNTLEANLARLMAYRNLLSASASSNGFDSDSFLLYWGYIKQVLVSLGMSKEEVDNLKGELQDDENGYMQSLKKWVAEEKDTEKQLQDIETEQHKQNESMTSMQKTVTKVLQGITVNDGPVKIVGNIEFDTSKKNIIGRGGKGTVVYHGTLKTGKMVAVKKVLTATFDKEEIDKLKKLQHPHIVRCWDTVELDEFTYLALELCNKTLAQCIKEKLFRTGQLQLDQLSCLLQMAEAIYYLHNMKVCHRDIKPENILVILGDEFGKQRFLLADFNTARDVKDETFSTNNSTAGTNGWIAPELYHLGERRTLKVDVFSFGCVCFNTLTNGNHPFGERSDLKECQRYINTGAQAVHLFCLDDSAAAHNKLGNLVFAMTQKDPDFRPTAMAVCTELKVILADVASKVNVRLGDQRRPHHPIELCFNEARCSGILWTHDFTKFDKYFIQCRTRFLEGQIGIFNDKEESFKTRFKLLILEVLYLARERSVNPTKVIQNPRHHGIYSLYQSNYLGETYPEKEVKSALTQKIKVFQDLDERKLKIEYVITLESAKSFQFYELSVQKKQLRQMQA